MTADIANQRKPTGPSAMLHTLTMVFAAVTLFFALLSMILGNRSSTLQDRFVQAEKETATSEAMASQKIETELQAASTNLGNMQQALDKEKAAAEKIRIQLSVVMKDHAKNKAALDIANKTIADLKSTVAPQPALQQTNPSVPLSVPAQVPVKKPDVNSQQPLGVKTPEPPAVTPAKQLDVMTPPASAPLSSADGSTVAEETITDSSQAPSTDVPATE